MNKVKAFPVMILVIGLFAYAGSALSQPAVEWERTHAGMEGDYGYQVQAVSDGGFIIVGNTHSSSEQGYFGSDVWLVKTDAGGDTLWTRIFGGAGIDGGHYVEETSDSGFIITGFSASFGAGDVDLYLLRTDRDGNLLWSKTYGGVGGEEGNTVHQTVDGGFIVAGNTSSYPFGDANYWMLRTDANGDTLWTKVLGTSEGDWAQSVEQTIDGGFILAGHSFYFASNRSAVYLVKTDSLGNGQWTNHYIGSGTEYPSTVHQTPDGGYIVAGWTTSYGMGGSDIYLLKVDSLGAEQWHQAYGTTGDDGCDGFGSVLLTSDDGYVVAGRQAVAGGSRGWLLKTDSAGDTLWSALLGGSESCNGRSVALTPDGGYVVAGSKFGANPGQSCLSITKTDATGSLLWEKNHEGMEGDYGYQVQATSDGGFIIVGNTHSSSEQGYFGSDVWLVKTDAVGDTLWTKIFGGAGIDGGYYVEETSDSGFIITGFSASFGAGDVDLYLLRTDRDGNLLWSKTYGGVGGEVGNTVHQTVDAGFIIAGNTSSYPYGDANYWMLRTDANGDTLWAKVFGTSEGDWAQSVEPTIDGGFILAGHSFYFASNRSAVYLIKTDSLGNSEWTNHYIGSGTEYPSTVHQTPDGGYIIAGWTTSYGMGGSDIYLLKVDSLGAEQWHKAYGGTGDDGCDGFGSILMTSDDGFIVAGRQAVMGGTRGWLLKTDSAGDTLWSILLGESGYSNARSVSIDASGNYIVAGSFWTDTTGADLYLAKVVDMPSEVDDNISGPLPTSFMLYQNTPNPFNPGTKIRFTLERSARVKLDIVNVLGQEVVTLIDEDLLSGEHVAFWDGSDAAGQVLAGGVYFYRLQVGGKLEAKKMILLK